VISTARITHATPAATYAHVPNRDWESDTQLPEPAVEAGCRDIARQLLEFDHGDLFRDLADVQRSFSHVIRLVPQNGFILFNGDEENLRSLLPVDWCPCVSVGKGENNDLRIERFSEDAEGARFRLRWRGALWAEVFSPMPGIYNARNAAIAMLATGLALNPDDPFCAVNADALANYQGVKRRQEVLGEYGHLVILEDFAHHPTAVAQVLRSLRARYPGYRLTACFEPRSNTAVTNRFQEPFTDALALADAVYLGPVHRSERYAPGERLDTQAMAAELNRRGSCSGEFADFSSLLEELIAATKTKTDRPRCVVFLTNGGFGGVQHEFASAMKP